MIKSEKGYTMLEMVLTILIATLIMGAITTMLVVMTKSYELNQDTVDIQYQAQITLNTLVEDIKYSKGIKKVYSMESPTTDISSTTDSTKVSLFCLQTLQNKYTYFKLQDNKLYYIEEMDSGDLVEGLEIKEENLLATHVTYISLTPMSGNFKDSKSINIELGFDRREAKIVVSNQATIRNK